MEADFSGWATKAGLTCSDGRTIMPDAFKHQDKIQVPLVWQHGHKDPENVLGHAILENRPGEGVYCYGFFNNTPKASHIKEALIHKDIKHLSIWANELVERSKKVFHGAIREVSLVLSGANPGALIDNVTLRHADGSEDELDDEAIIYTGIELELEHSDVNKDDKKEEDSSLEHAEDAEEDEESLQEVYNSMNEKQKNLLHFMLGEALADVEEDDEEADTELEQSDLNDENDEEDPTPDSKGNEEMKHHNVFETKDEDGNVISKSLSHDDVKGIVADATKMGSLKDAVESYALAHGIQDIDILFPEARAVQNTPELLARRTEWVSDLMGKVRKTPFSRIKTFSADLTVAEARAKGYIKGNLKKEEFFRVSRRVTEPTTIYKKQKLDRDDILDITDFDVVVWMKAEMRIMLEEEIARAILVGDGRAADDEDKVNEEKIRPIATDHELFVTHVYVNLGDTNSSLTEALDAIVLNRQHLRGTSLPTLYTTETYIARILLLRDNQGRKLYRTLDEVASDLRVSAIVPVEILSEYDDIMAILVNPVDYTVGADRGGDIAMFDDFDIDYNQYKYLMETRISGALTKLKSALVVHATPANSVLVTPPEPGFDGDAITITDTTGVVYRNAVTDVVMNAAGSPYPVADGETVRVKAEPAEGYHFATSNDDEWSFTGDVG